MIFELFIRVIYFHAKVKFYIIGFTAGIYNVISSFGSDVGAGKTVDPQEYEKSVENIDEYYDNNSLDTLILDIDT